MPHFTKQTSNETVCIKTYGIPNFTFTRLLEGCPARMRDSLFLLTQVGRDCSRAATDQRRGEQRKRKGRLGEKWSAALGTSSGRRSQLRGTRHTSPHRRNQPSACSANLSCRCGLVQEKRTAPISCSVNCTAAGYAIAMLSMRKHIGSVIETKLNRVMWPVIKGQIRVECLQQRSEQ